MIFGRRTILRMLFPGRAAAAEAVARWSEAAERQPELVADVIRMGGVLTMQPRRYVEGVEVPEPIDPMALARAEGRRELALEMLALMTVTPGEFRDLMENDDEMV